MKYGKRLQIINRKSTDLRSVKYVVYWMQQSQRAEHNHALEYAAHTANDMDLPLIVIFIIMENYPEANLRHYTFMLEGLTETRNTLSSRGIPMITTIGEPEAVIETITRSAAALICDRGYLEGQRRMRDLAARQTRCTMYQVDGDAVIPPEKVSRKTEYGAFTLRPKYHKTLADGSFLNPVKTVAVKHPAHSIQVPGIDDIDPLNALQRLNTDRSVEAVSRYFPGGSRAAEQRLNQFIKFKLADYETGRNRPEKDSVSGLSPYLHFGQISPVYLTNRIRSRADSHPGAVEAWLEQFLIRRELAVNFVINQKDYNAYSAVTPWARETLDTHRNDPRPYHYALNDLLSADTHDPYWNAAMKEMLTTGYMHNTMRMYWGKKILEWSESPEAAHETLLHLNNRFFLDGRDPNSYAGCGWIFGLHDRPFKERPIYGKVRSMTAAGLKRKYDMNAYCKRFE